MLEEHALDYVETGDQNQVLLAINNPDHTAIIHDPEVTRASALLTRVSPSHNGYYFGGTT
ncbi:hypothetical protein M3A49_13240 [Paraburkholderia sp. CNPSo 3076]|nr:hypothetical protein [Paraburkholderia sp. CNPSo 3076]